MPRLLRKPAEVLRGLPPLPTLPGRADRVDPTHAARYKHSSHPPLAARHPEPHAALWRRGRRRMHERSPGPSENRWLWRGLAATLILAAAAWHVTYLIR